MGLLWTDIKAIAFPTSIALPPPIVITPSQSFGFSSVNSSPPISEGATALKLEDEILENDSIQEDNRNEIITNDVASTEILEQPQNEINDQS